MASLPRDNIRLTCGCQEVEWSHPLEDFGTQLALVTDLPAFEYDCENVYEWGQTLIGNNQIEVNISRKHGAFNPPPGAISVILLVSGNAPIEWDEQWLTEHLLPQYTKIIRDIMTRGE